MGINRPGAFGGTVIPRAIGTQFTITGTSGVWTDVTPSAVSANLTDPDFGATADNYGVQDVLADPRYPGHFYCFVCYLGCWRSTDYGLTWIKISGASILDTGKTGWSSAISKNGDYILCTSGNNFSTSGDGSAAEVRHTVQRSQDAGISWVKSATLNDDVYCVRCSPFDNLRCLACTKTSPSHVWESLDGGQTWTDLGTFSASLGSAYIHYLGDSDTALFVGQDGGASHRLTKSGGTWSSSQITDLNNVGHYHGSHELVHDPAQGAFWFPASGGTAGTEGIWKSTNNGSNWTRVHTVDADVMCKTATNLYTIYGAPASGTTTNDAKFASATLNPGTSFGSAQNLNTLYGMRNGAKRMAVSSDGARTVIIAGAWCAGIWRYVE